MPARRSQAERSAQTRGALLDTGRRLFAERGVAEVSAEQLVAEAGVTRGALYHHFRGKEDLFRAVFEQLEEQLCAELTVVIDAQPTPVHGLLAAIGAFLDATGRQDVRQIALVDAPTVLGWSRWREIEARYALGILTDRLRAAEADGIRLSGPVDVLAQLGLSMAIESAMMIAGSERPDEVRPRVEGALQAIATGFFAAGSG